MVTISVTAVCSHLPFQKMSLLPRGYNPGSLAGSMRPRVSRAQHLVTSVLRKTHSPFPAPCHSCAPASSLGLSFSRKPPRAVTSFLDLHQLLGLAALWSPFSTTNRNQSQRIHRLNVHTVGYLHQKPPSPGKGLGTFTEESQVWT